MPRPEKKTGCTTFDVRIAAGTLVTAAPTTPIPCGPIEPVLVASPTFDSAHGTVTLAVALVNRGPDRLHIPTALVAAKPGLVITVGAPTPSPRAAIVQPPTPQAPPPVATVQPPPPEAPPPAAPPPPPVPSSAQTPGTVIIVGGPPVLAGSVRPATGGGAKPATAGGGQPPTVAALTIPQGEALHFTDADVQPIDSTSPAPPNPRWSFDKLLQKPSHDPVTADDGSIVLPPGDTSAARPITIAVPRGVTAFRVSLQGEGLYVFTVPGRAPDTVPREEMEDSRAPDNLVTNDPHYPGRVVRNKLWLMFRPDATPEARQAAVDAVDGVVVGGMLRGQARYYYLRIPANPDSGAAPLEHALRTLAPLPQVQDVMVDRNE